MKLLGTEYKIKLIKEPDEYMKKHNLIGVCDYDLMEIKVCENWYGDITGKRTVNSIQNTLLHELAHMFLYETGQDNLNDERHAELLSKFSKFIINNIEEIKMIVLGRE